MCRVDFSHSGKLTMKGEFKNTANGLVLSFGEPVISDLQIKMCKSSYCRSK